MNTTDEFIKAILSIEPITEPEIEYRFYYNETGQITTCSQTNHQETGDYVVVTQEEYQHYYQYYIVDSKLKKIDVDPGYRVQLKKSTSGYAVVKNHAGIILENEDCKNAEYYESN